MSHAPTVVNVEPTGDTTFVAQFSDGHFRLFDLRRIGPRGVFEPVLSSPTLFRTVHPVEYGAGVEWDNGAALSPEAVYDEGQPIYRPVSDYDPKTNTLLIAFHPYDEAIVLREQPVRDFFFLHDPVVAETVGIECRQFRKHTDDRDWLDSLPHFPFVVLADPGETMSLASVLLQERERIDWLESVGLLPETCQTRAA